MNVKKIVVLGVSDYQNILGISAPTARKYMRQDLKTLGRLRITNLQFEKLYGEIEKIKQETET